MSKIQDLLKHFPFFLTKFFPQEQKLIIKITKLSDDEICNYTDATIICSSKSDNLKQDEIKFSQSVCLRYPFIFFSIGLRLPSGRILRSCSHVTMSLTVKNIFQDS